MLGYVRTMSAYSWLQQQGPMSKSQTQCSQHWDPAHSSLFISSHTSWHLSGCMCQRQSVIWNEVDIIRVRYAFSKKWHSWEPGLDFRRTIGDLRTYRMKTCIHQRATTVLNVLPSTKAQADSHTYSASSLQMLYCRSVKLAGTFYAKLDIFQIIATQDGKYHILPAN